MGLMKDLFLTFARIGLFTFGGGYAMIAMIENYCVEQKKWITHDEMMDVTAIAESTPGPIAINAATYVGYRQGGMKGAVLATVGIVLPSFLLIYLISMALDQLLEIHLVANALKGLKVGVALLILDAGVTMLRKMPAKPLPRIIMLCALAAMLLINIFALKISSIALMAGAGLVSLALFLGKGGKKK